MAFKPRRTPPPSIAGVNLKPRPNPVASITPPPPKDDSPKPTPRGGEGRNADWISPHHRDHYNRVNTSTMDHPMLMHGDPHMPIQQFTRGDGKVVLDPFGGKAKELNDHTKVGRKDLLLADYGDDVLGEDEDNDGEDDDELEREFGSDAADAIRSHLNTFNTRLNSAKGKDSNTFSPLDEVEEQFRTIDRLTSAQGSTQDLALRRRSRTETRDFYRLGSIPKLAVGTVGDVDELLDGDGKQGGVEEGDKEFGHGRGYDAENVFGKAAKVQFPYGKDWPSPTYHKDFPKGSNVGNNPNDPDEEKWMHELNKLIYEEQYTEFELGEIEEYTPVNVQKEDMDKHLKEKERTKKYDMLAREDEHEKDREEKPDQILEMIKNGDDPNQEAFGPWGECTIKVDRVQKVERGGTTVRYRALVIGGNGNGAAGFGIGKALSPNEAMVKACKHCKRNVFYIDRYLNSGLSYDLAGKHNSCRVKLRAVGPDYGLHGHPLICEILKYAGISDATSKSHGNRNPYNVVYATFKALMTHESLEDIAMKRGVKLLTFKEQGDWEFSASLEVAAVVLLGNL
eukprot:CAMPEP_0201868434 /NCGR_PEP_ID=MMETSP0902-20130614/2321_1 /ASSEMBLY_ACC=CAM_ASM_000551 /TAXON_ID=420261 /ORGANISM="Thalassiosira antarctica, Strain CCMP982" /LENGTH=565 /DNA_ID=CAMNT_0048393777 /DNA_START=263 /DNA_END=1961 /DNA_ORIENTATION=+